MYCTMWPTGSEEMMHCSYGERDQNIEVLCLDRARAYRGKNWRMSQKIGALLIKAHLIIFHKIFLSGCYDSLDVRSR